MTLRNSLVTTCFPISLTLLVIVSFDVSACSFCDKTISLSNDVFECFGAKTREYIREAESGPIIVDYGSCNDVSSSSEFHEANPRMSTPVIENDCASNSCAETANDDAFFSLLSQNQLICLRNKYPSVFDPEKGVLVIDLNDCAEATQE